MRLSCFALWLACLAVPVAPGQPLTDAAAGEAPLPAYDHYDPVLLNESAIEAIRRGDLRTAWILLERAARLAPHDPRIGRNARELRAHRMGGAAPPESPSPVVRPGPEPRIPAEPPAIWSPR